MNTRVTIIIYSVPYLSYSYISVNYNVMLLIYVDMQKFKKWFLSCYIAYLWDVIPSLCCLGRGAWCAVLSATNTHWTVTIIQLVRGGGEVTWLQPRPLPMFIYKYFLSSRKLPTNNTAPRILRDHTTWNIYQYYLFNIKKKKKLRRKKC
jgi:hypothetical protein